MSSWVDTNIQPEIIWYRSSNSSVYVGTLPKVNLSISGTQEGDHIRLEMTVYWRNGYYNQLPNTTFIGTWHHGYYERISFYDSYNRFWENCPDYEVNSSGVYIYIDAYLIISDGDGNSSTKYFGYWPNSNTNGITGTITKSSYKPQTSYRSKSTNTSLFGNVTLNRKFW